MLLLMQWQWTDEMRRVRGVWEKRECHLLLAPSSASLGLIRFSEWAPKKLPSWATVPKIQRGTVPKINKTYIC